MSTEERLIAAYKQGVEAAKQDKFKTEYVSGSGLFKQFCKGFVAQAVKQDTLPADTPMFLQGRIAYLKDVPVEGIPEGETYAGRWFSGWLMEKDKDTRPKGAKKTMSKIVARPVTKTEPDLLIGFEQCALQFTDLDGVIIKQLSAPESGWTHDALEAAEYELPDEVHALGWDAHLIGATKHWIGSSEI